jgi:hypothetical protein
MFINGSDIPGSALKAPVEATRGLTTMRRWMTLANAERHAEQRR